MGEVQHLGDAVDHGVAQSNDGIDAAQAETTDQIVEEFHKHTSFFLLGSALWQKRTRHSVQKMPLSFLP